MMSGCACAVESRGPNRRRLVICWRKGGEFDNVCKCPCPKRRAERSARGGMGELLAAVVVFGVEDLGRVDIQCDNLMADGLPF
jgi:hypothetical protein